MESNWLPCSVSPGQFPDEYAVSGEEHNGRSFSLFAPLIAVHGAGSTTAEALLRVEVVDRKGDLALIRLPAQTFENGQYVTVHARQLQALRHGERVGA